MPATRMISRENDSIMFNSNVNSSFAVNGLYKGVQLEKILYSANCMWLIHMLIIISIIIHFDLNVFLVCIYMQTELPS